MDACPTDDDLADEAAKIRETERPRRKNSPTVRPITESASQRDTGTRYSIAQRSQALTLHSIGWKTAQIAAYTKIPERSVRAIAEKARKRGFTPQEDPRVLDHFVEDGYKPGRPREVLEVKEEEVLSSLRTNRSTREKSAEVLAYEHGVSTSTALRILHKHGLNSVKPTTKPGLNLEQRAARLAFCLAHQDWTLEDWKKVIWSDETSVILGHRRGSIRVWRTPEEPFEKSVIRRRWKGYSEFMFWGCFTYDKIGPCHIYRAETAAEKEASQKEINELNEALESEKRKEWELSNGVRRLGLRNLPGRKPKWRFTKETGKLVRRGKGGIDWWRYYKEVVLPKLIPFARECGPDAIIQEDNASPHAYHFIGRTYSIQGLNRMLWPGNSPDLSAIEKGWPWMKRVTTFKGAPRTRTDLETSWMSKWGTIPQDSIRGWIEGIMENIKKVIALEGGNEYPEGRESKRSYKGRRRIGELFKHSWIQDDQDSDSEDSENSDDYEDIETEEEDEFDADTTN